MQRLVKASATLQIIICLSVLSVVAAINAEGQQVLIQKGIAEEIIRFHVLANSDSANDQALKLKVKSQIVLYLQSALVDAYSINSAREILKREKNNIEKIAKEVMKKEGYNYSVTVKLEKYDFPTKVYGDLTFPAGEYQALRVLIGKAEGKNWWCVMFPSLCFINETYCVVPKTSKQQLQYMLTEEEYNSLLQPSTEETPKPSTLIQEEENINEENINEDNIESTNQTEKEDESIKSFEIKFKIIDIFKNL